MMGVVAPPTPSGSTSEAPRGAGGDIGFSLHREPSDGRNIRRLFKL